MKNEKTDYQTILTLLQELIEAGKETDRRMKETDQRFKETGQLFKDTIKSSNQLIDRRIKVVENNIDKLNQLVGGMGNNQGLAAEEEFFNSFVKTMRLGDMKFHSIERNLRKHCDGIQDEFDIVLTNSEIILLAEVKFNFHHNDVKNVLNKISNFKKLYPQYQNFQVYGAVAGKILSKKTIEAAKKFNLFVVAQEGNELRLINVPS
jgi:hypothetical protein